MARAIHDAVLRPRGDGALLGACVLLFAAAVAATLAGCHAMAAMGGMAMPGGWVLSMAWMRMPGQGWPGVVAVFLGMWTAMMAAMMLPSLLPMLQRYREAAGRAAPARSGRLTLRVAAGYFLIWLAFGAAVLPLGLVLAQAELRLPALARAVPALAGAVVLAAGVLQLTPWKARRLACCRSMPAPGLAVPTAAAAWRHGLRLGLHCSGCCLPQMAVLLGTGLMDLRAMAVATIAITIERLAPAGEYVARAIGVVAVAAGVLLVRQALALW